MRRAAHNVVKLPIEFSFILSRVFSLKVATFCSNPFEHVSYHDILLNFKKSFHKAFVQAENNDQSCTFKRKSYIHHPKSFLQVRFQGLPLYTI